MSNEKHEQEGGGNESRDIEEKPEREPKPIPRIYAASLSDYNAGRLHGTWIDADQDADDLASDIQTMLDESPTPFAEEWAIHDYEGFGPLRLREYEDLVTISRLGLGITEHGMAFAHWASVASTDRDELERFEDVYLGHADTVEAYAEQLLDELGYPQILEEALPDHMQPYVTLDVEGFARDLELSGDITTSDGDGGVYVFDPGR